MVNLFLDPKGLYNHLVLKTFPNKQLYELVIPNVSEHLHLKFLSYRFIF